MIERKMERQIIHATEASMDRPNFKKINSKLHESSENVKKAIQTVLEEGDGFSEKEGEQFYGLDSKDLELARIWCWQNLDFNNYTADSILELYQFMQESWQDKLPLGPTAFRYSKTIEEIKAQHTRTKKILGNNLEAFTKDEKINFAKIDDYEIKMHKHDCAFGAGLICLSMWRQDRKVFQVSFYPTNPFKIYEIKGGKSNDDITKNRKRKRDYHRFNSKYKITPPSTLVIECLKIAQNIGVEVDIAGLAPLWRNYSLANNKDRENQANSVYWKVKKELKLSYDKQTESLIEVSKALNQIYSEPKTEINDGEKQDKYTRCIELIQSSAEQNQLLFEGGKDEFITKLLFSSYTDEHIQLFFDTQRWNNFKNYENNSWELFLITIKHWAKQNFQIPQRNSENSSEKDSKEDWLYFDLPLFMKINTYTRDKIIENYLQLLEKNG